MPLSDNFASFLNNVYKEAIDDDLIKLIIEHHESGLSKTDDEKVK